MPHLTLEYSANLTVFDDRAVLLKLNQALISAGYFGEGDIKSRALPFQVFMVGTQPEGRAFVHVKLAILSGRDAQARQEISQTLAVTLREFLPDVAGLTVAACVEVREMDRVGFAKP